MPTIQALIVQTGQVETLIIREFYKPSNGPMVYALIAGSIEIYAEMDLTKPQEGWKVFPN